MLHWKFFTDYLLRWSNKTAHEGLNRAILPSQIGKHQQTTSKRSPTALISAKHLSIDNRSYDYWFSGTILCKRQLVVLPSALILCHPASRWKTFSRKTMRGRSRRKAQFMYSKRKSIMSLFITSRITQVVFQHLLEAPTDHWPDAYHLITPKNHPL